MLSGRTLVVDLVDWRRTILWCVVRGASQKPWSAGIG